MATPYKRQHYVPASYLRYFAIDQTACERQSHIWRISKGGAVPVRAESQCAATFHYSQANAKTAEEHFQRFEGRYCECVDAVRRGDSPSPQMYGDLLHCMLVLNLRNAAHVNVSDSEGLTAFHQRWVLTVASLLLGDPAAPLTQKLISDHIQTFWQLRILKTPRESYLMTSDNPCVWVTFSPSTNLLDLMILPLDPEHLAVAFDHRRVFFRDRPLNAQDISWLNGQQLTNCLSAVYSSKPLTSDNLKGVQSYFTSNQPLTKTEFTNEHWNARLAIWPPLPEVGFVAAIPPLM